MVFIKGYTWFYGLHMICGFIIPRSIDYIQYWLSSFPTFLQAGNGKPPEKAALMGQTSINEPFPIAVFDYQRVSSDDIII